MTVQNDRCEELRLLLKKQNIKIKTEESKDGFEIISLENCIFDATHKQAMIVFHPAGQVSYVCHTLACKGRTWDQVLMKLEGTEQGASFSQILTKTDEQNTTMPVFTLMKVSELKENPLNKILPPLSPEQKQGLKHRINRLGFNEALEITQTNFLLDGHNRFRIAKELGISEVPVVVINISEELQESYILEKNIFRRQLTIEQQSYLRGKIYQQEKKIIGAPQGNRNAQNNSAKIAELFSEGCETQTARNLAEKFHVSERTIRNDAQFAESIDTLQEASPEIAKKILSKQKINGQKNLNKKNVIQVAKQIVEKKANQEPIPTSEEEIMKLVDEKETAKSILEKKPHEENPTVCSTDLLLILKEILERIQRIRGHKDFSCEVMGKLNHIEEEFTNIIRIVSTKGECVI